MEAWMKKVEEMKKMREQKWQFTGQTASPQPLNSNAPLSRTRSDPKVSAQTTTKAPNPFLQNVNKQQSSPNLSKQSSTITSPTTIKPSSVPPGSLQNQKIATSVPQKTASSSQNSASSNPFLNKIALKSENPTELVKTTPNPSPLKPEATKQIENASSTSKSTDEARAKKIQERKSRRMTKRQTILLSNNVISTVESVFQQIGGVDKKLRQSEAARIQAEDKMMEIAIAKLEVDELLSKVDVILKKIVDSSTLTVPMIKDIIVRVRKQISSEDDNSVADRRFSIMIPKDALKLEEATPPPSNNNQDKVIGNSSSESFLDQIRKGKTLRNVTVSKLKEEQQQFRKQAREVIGNMRSLEEVLRDALTKRVTEMNLYEDENDSEDETWE